MKTQNNSFDGGANFAYQTYSSNYSFTVAYQMAIIESIFSKKPSEFMRGFVQSFRAEESKSLAA